MLSFFRKRRIRAMLDQTISAICPSHESSKRLVKMCERQETPDALIEAGIAQLFFLYRAVIAATEREDIRVSVIEKIKNKFLSEFRIVAEEAGMSESVLIELVADRLILYDRTLNKGTPDYQIRITHRIFEKVAGRRTDSPVAYIMSADLVAYAADTTKFLKKAFGLIFPAAPPHS